MTTFIPGGQPVDPRAPQARPSAAPGAGATTGGGWNPGGASIVPQGGTPVAEPLTRSVQRDSTASMLEQYAANAQRAGVVPVSPVTRSASFEGSSPLPPSYAAPSRQVAPAPPGAASQVAPAPPATAWPAGAAAQRPSAEPPVASAAPQSPTRAAASPTAPASASVPRAASRIGVARNDREDKLDLERMLHLVPELGASDLHLTARAAPMVRISGALRPLEGFGVLNPDQLQHTLYQLLTQRQREKFEEELELDFSYQVHGGPRFRVNYYNQRESIGAAFRIIPSEILSLEQLGVPARVGEFAGLPRGLVLVTGPTGSGKSTTLAAIIDRANRTRAEHIMTVEDPIEFLHEHRRAIVNQREVGADTHSFNAALKHALRQDPDIILVGELRDLETISVALTAAETGHLVFATLHTQDAAQTIDRVIDVFPAHQQEQVRAQLAGAIQGVVCQTLCKRADGQGRVVATEVLVATPAIRNLVREGKTHQVYSAMQAGADHGMHTMDQHLADLVRQGRITYEMGLDKCHHVEDYNRLTGRDGGMSADRAGGGLSGAGFGDDFFTVDEDGAR